MAIRYLSKWKGVQFVQYPIFKDSFHFMNSLAGSSGNEESEIYSAERGQDLGQPPPPYSVIVHLFDTITHAP
jgi:hypothetical protein